MSHVSWAIFGATIVYGQFDDVNREVVSAGRQVFQQNRRGSSLRKKPSSPDRAEDGFGLILRGDKNHEGKHANETTQGSDLTAR